MLGCRLWGWYPGLRAGMATAAPQRWPRVSAETLGGSGGPGADVSSPPLCPAPWGRISQAQVSDAGLYTCIASSRAGVADRSFVLRIRGTGQPGAWGEQSGGHPSTNFAGRAHITLCSCVSKQGPEPVLSRWGGLGEDGARQDQPESGPRARWREAEPPLGARRTPGNCQTHLLCLETRLSSHGPAKGGPLPPQCPPFWKAQRAARSRWWARAPMSPSPAKPRGPQRRR